MAGRQDLRVHQVLAVGDAGDRTLLGAGRRAGEILAGALLHHAFLESLLFAVAFAMGLTPEFLPMISAVTLSRGAAHMARQKVIVKHLEAIENFGSMDVDDLAALGDEAPRFLSAREEERAEPELVAQAPRGDQIPIRAEWE